MASTNESCLQVVQYIHRHYNEKLSLEKLAKIFYINPAYLGRIFSRNMGMTFSDYLLSYRIRMAMEILKQEDIMIMDVARAVGYNNLNYFYRVFKEHTGVTPSQYRSDIQKMFQHEFQPTRRGSGGARFKPEGEVVCRMSARQGNTLGNILRGKNGCMRCFYLDRGSRGGIALMAVESMDLGSIWSEPRCMFEEPDEEYMTGLTVLQMLDGSIGAFYLLGDIRGGVCLCCRRSYDDCHVWSERSLCRSLSAGHFLENGRILRLQSGRLVAPFSRSVINMDFFQRQQLVRHYCSDDDGVTWYASGMNVSLTCRHTQCGLQSPMLLELKDGALLGYAATDLGRQYEYSSRDRGDTWTSPMPSFFTSPMAAMHMAYVGEECLAVVYNPVPEYPVGCGLRRQRLVYSISADHGKSWSRAVILEETQDTRITQFCSPMICGVGKDCWFVAYRVLEHADSGAKAFALLRRIPLNTDGGVME